MLELAVGALLIALLAGALGFTGIARAAGTVAKIAFVLFMIVALLLFFMVWAGVSLFT